MKQLQTCDVSLTSDWIARARPLGRPPRGLCAVEGRKEERDRLIKQNREKRGKRDQDVLDNEAPALL